MEKSNPSQTYKIEVEPTKDTKLLAQFIEQLQKRNLHLTKTMATHVAFARQKMLEAGQLKKEPCLFCKLGPSVVTVQQREEQAQRYLTDISLSGFHCDK